MIGASLPRATILRSAGELSESGARRGGTGAGRPGAASVAALQGCCVLAASSRGAAAATAPIATSLRTRRRREVLGTKNGSACARSRCCIATVNRRALHGAQGRARRRSARTARRSSARTSFTGRTSSGRSHATLVARTALRGRTSLRISASAGIAGLTPGTCVAARTRTSRAGLVAARRRVATRRRSRAGARARSTGLAALSGRAARSTSGITRASRVVVRSTAPHGKTKHDGYRNEAKGIPHAR